jgi:ABC-type dipeptide/oligopeptide/nickel transport system permease component
MLGGTIVTETVFARPGLGRLLVESIHGRDYPQVQAVVTFFVMTFVLVNMVVDVLYGYLDPRIRVVSK